MKRFYFLGLLMCAFTAFAGNLPRKQLIEGTYSSPNAIVVQADTVWLGTYDGVEKRLKNGKLLKHFTEHSDVYSLMLDNAGFLWVGTYYGLFQLKNGQWVDVSNKSELLKESIYKLYKDAKNVVWAVSKSYGIVAIDGNSIKEFHVATDFAKEYVYSVLSEDTVTWFGTSNGVVRYNGTTFKAISNKTTKGNYVYDLVRLNKDSLFVTTSNGYKIVSKDTLYPNSVQNDESYDFLLPAPKGNILIVDNQVFFYDGKSFTDYSFDKSDISGAFVEGDTLWVATSSGVYLHYNSEWHRFNRLTGGQIFNLTCDSENNIWFHQDNVICKRSDSGDIQLFELPNKYTEINSISCSIKQGVWVATNENGLYQILNNTLYNFTHENSALPSNSVYSLIFDGKDSLWISTENGVIRKEGSTWKTFTSTDGLACDHYNKLSKAADGSLVAFGYPYDDYCSNNKLSIFRNNAWVQEQTIDTLWVLNAWFDAQGRKWLWGDTTLYMYDNKWHKYQQSSSTTRITLIEKNGTAWVGGYYYLSHIADSIVSTNDMDDRVLSLVQDSSGSILVSVNNYGIYKIHKPSASFNYAAEACKGKKVTLTAQSSSSLDKYHWDINRDGIPDVSGKTIEYAVTPAKDSIIDSVSLFVENGFDTTVIKKEIKIHKPVIPQIGVVTVSDNGKSLLVAWERKKDARIAAYKIYRKSMTKFDSIGQVSFDSIGVYRDDKSNYVKNAYTYKLTAIDDCGVESPLDSSVAHTSIHASLSLSPTSGKYELSWEKYKGMSIRGYYIYETKDGYIDRPIDSLDEDKVSYSVINAKPGFSYRVGAVLLNEIDPKNTKSDSGPFSQSLSSMSEAFLVSLADFTGVDVITYPQIATDEITVVATGKEAFDFAYYIISLDGHIIKNGSTSKATSLETVIPVSDLSKGTYELRTIINGFSKVFTFVKQ